MNKHKRSHSTKEGMKDYKSEEYENCCSSNKCGNLCPVSFGLALGITKGLFVLLIGLAITFYNWGQPIVQFLQLIHKGFTPSVASSLCGSLWALLTGFTFGYVLISIYGFILCGCKRVRCRSDECKWDKKQ